MQFFSSEKFPQRIHPADDLFEIINHLCCLSLMEEILIDIYVWEWNDDVNDDLEK